ncbi:hypothetical protein GGF46_002126 [Coemansia sp. RSA 552]|nr:hypothetical protein GGF46_002126 [Coemansia sp. RSA 552]
MSFRGNRDYERVLVGFDVQATPTKCVLRIPRPVEGEAYTLTVAVTDNDWEEATVSGATKNIDGTRIGGEVHSDSAGRAQLDVSEACRQGRNSFFVDTAGTMLQFAAGESGGEVFQLEVL